MSEDIKAMFENIQKETDVTKKAELQTALDNKLKELNEDSIKFKEIEQKGIFKELKEAKEKLKALEDAENLTKEEKLKAEGKLNEIIESKTAKLTTLEQQLETEKAEKEKYKAGAEAFEKYKEDRKKILMEVLKNDDLKELAKELPTLESLEKFVKLHSAGVIIPGTDGNGQPHTPGSVVLTEDEKTEAETMNVTPEAYKEIMAYRKKKQEENKK
jgi:DNA repair exonuclease SbcCD ATPase subunit